MNSLRKTLQDLPDGLYETYDRILLNVPEVHRVHVQRALIWLAFSGEPMTLGQVAEAVLVDREQQSMDPGDQFRDVHDLLDLCSSFVCLAGRPPLLSPIRWLHKRAHREQVASDSYLILRLTHSSVKEYILSERANIAALSMHRLTSEIAQCFIVEACLVYLNQFADESLVRDETLQRHQFLFYAVYQWYFHYDSMTAEEEDNVAELLLSFVNTRRNGYAYRNWLNFESFFSPFDRHRRPLAALSLLGAYRAVREIVADAAEAYLTEDIIMDSLYCASRGGHKAIVRVLLDAGAKLNCARVVDASPLNMALREAILGGHTEVIEVLISQGATTKVDYSCVSRIAASQGKVYIVKLSLDCTTTDYNKMGAFYGALQAAILARQRYIIEYLMKRSAEIDITAKEDLYFATLQKAFFEKDDSTVEFLINRAFGSKTSDTRKAMLKVLDTSCTPRTKLVLLQILVAGTDHPLLKRNHERDYIPIEDQYWESAVEIEYTIKEILLAERKLLEEEDLIDEAMDLLQRIRSLSAAASPTIETESNGSVE